MYRSGYCFVLYVLLSVVQFTPTTCTSKRLIKNSCTTDPADVIFLLDGSGSVGSGNFATTLEFVNKIVDGFPIGTSSTQVSVAVFTHNTFDFKFNLNTYSTKQPLKAHITSIPFPSGGEDIREALEQARHKFLDSNFGSRPNAAGIVVLITDGQSSSIQPSIASAQKLKYMGVTIYTAGVGSGANENELRGIASKHSYYFSCNDFNSLNTLSGPITAAACTDIADWDGCKCLNGGTCVPSNLGASCQCPTAYTGFYCDKNTCEVANPCMNGATCSISGDTWVCSCLPAYTGNTCNTDINECASSPCVHGTCHDLVNRFYCSCIPGYKGSMCETEIDECASNPCRHAGSCIDHVNAFSCDCVAGYSGSVCEIDIDECLSSPCENGGTCNDRVNAYTCDCLQGYYGDYCETEIDECASNPCRHGGSCTDHINAFSCGCVAGYTGSVCEIDINECASNPCVHGSCNDRVNSYHCYCTAGYEGDRCDKECDYGTYGLNCSAECGHCQTNTFCHRITGICESGCMKGYTGATCHDAEEDPLPIGTIAGACVGVVAIVCVTVIVVCVVKYKRRQPHPSVNTPMGRMETVPNSISSPYENLQCNDKMDDTTYETIDP